MMNRRKFCTSLALGAAGWTVLSSFRYFTDDAISTEKITILHTNDTHSHIDPFPEDHAQYPGQGGVMRRAGLVEQIRSEEEHVLLLDAGDTFQGTPYFNMYGGEIEMKMMSQLKYDASTMGNHDFDAGLEGFDKVLPLSDFPFLCSNYNFDDTILAGKTKEYEIFTKGALKIGIFGLGVALDGLVSKTNFGNTIYLDPVNKAQQMADLLKEELRCDLVICLSHLGYDYKTDQVSDRSLAHATSKIDLIIGGHTHTFLDAPVVVKNKIGQETIINQVGWGGINLGRIDLHFERDKNGGMASVKNKGQVINVA